jgi:hypothetical protein
VLSLLAYVQLLKFFVPALIFGFDSESIEGNIQRWLVPEAMEDPVCFRGSL